MELLERDVYFREEILQLISLQQEGGYWDFKRQWYTNKTDMLHDIICMSNNLHNRAAYIIIGIDEEKNYSVVDVSGDPNRKNTQKIVDFLKDKKFAGGIRPIVHVESVCCSGGTIDVIVIENSHSTPFYLTNQYEGVHANNIYTRIMDTTYPGRTNLPQETLDFRRQGFSPCSRYLFQHSLFCFVHMSSRSCFVLQQNAPLPLTFYFKCKSAISVYSLAPVIFRATSLDQ